MKYQTIAVVEWSCKRCGEDVMESSLGRGKCGCDYVNSSVSYPLEDGTLELAIAASPWEPKQCLNGTGESELILFRRESRQKC